jgi:uncharacterized membrane-anchored protein
MKLTHPKLAAVLAFPILCLFLWAGFSSVRLQTGTEVTIPIVGFDPRDILAGHYLTYRLDLPHNKICKNSLPKVPSTKVCLKSSKGTLLAIRWPKPISQGRAEGCTAVLQGSCKSGRFLAGIEKFYIPEGDARELDIAVRRKKGAVVVSVDRIGNGMVKDLLIDGQSWRKYVK